MDDLSRFLIDQLKRGDYCGGDELGAALSMSRVAVSKRMNALKKLGVPIESTAGKGYRLVKGQTLLDEATLLTHLPQELCEAIHHLEIHAELDSTNRRASEISGVTGKAHLVLAESQPAGRGRRDRVWVSTPWRNLMWSLGWRFGSWPSDLPATSLLAGVVAARSLEMLGVNGLRIKWPNDLYLNGKKLGGLLVSARGDANGECDLVIGIGINCHIDPLHGALIDQPWIDLQSAGHSIDRNQLAALLLQGFLEYLPIFEREGFAPFVDDWNARALYLNEPVRLFRTESGPAPAVVDDTKSYLCRGADRDGSLLLDHQGEIVRLRDADYSLRPV